MSEKAACGCESSNSSGTGTCGVEVVKTSAAGAMIGGAIGGLIAGPPGAAAGAAIGGAIGAKVAGDSDHCRPKQCECR